MKTLCALVTFRPPVAPSRLLGARTVDQWLASTLDEALPGMPRVALGPFATAEAFVGALEAASAGYDEVVLVASDAPLVRPDLIVQLVDLHRRYRADYTFADGYPVGLAPEVLRPGVLATLAPWAANRRGEVDRETLFQLLSTDINRFDIETDLSPIDLRSRRLSLTADSLRGWTLLERYVDDAGLATKDFLGVIESTADRTRTLPATLHVQVTDGVLQVPVWSPVLQFAPEARTQRNFLDRGRWNDLLDRALALSGDLTVLPSFWGEPSLHPQIVELLSDALAKPGLRVCVETSGLGWNLGALEALAAQGAASLDWVVELDSDVPETYARMRGEGFAEAQEFTQGLIKLFPGRVWPQTVRMAMNEGEMEAFYQRWKAGAGQVIIQKHNDFGGRLPRAKPSDLSPWKRHPCWHLARDLSVFLDGTTVVCRDDFSRSQPLGNVWSEDLAQVWARGASLFARHVREDWPEVCRNCDEWYTFHF